MKKIYSSILSIAAALLTVAPCYARDNSAASRSGSFLHSGLYSARTASDAVVKKTPAIGGIALKPQSHSKPTKAISFTGEMITEAPAGEVHSSQVRSSMSFFVEFGGAYLDKVDAMVGEFVVGDDGYIYIKNPFAFLTTDTYMKARIEGDEAVLTLPQPIYCDDVYGTGEMQDLYVARVKLDAANEWYNLDEQTQEIRFSYKDGILSQKDEKDIMYGLVTEEGEWLGYGDYSLVMKSVEEKLAVIPANVESSQYTLSHSLWAQLTNVAFDGEDVYIAGLNPDAPEACIAGKKDGNQVTFKAGQYLGVYNLVIDMETGETQSYHSYFMPAIITEEWNDIYGENIEVYKVVDELVFTIDPTTGIMTADKVILTNASKTMTYYIDAFEQARLIPYTGKKPAVPSDPIVTEEMEIKDWYGDGDIFGAISFVILPQDVNGNFIDLNDMYYNIIINDRLFTFTPEEFINLTETMTDIPYYFTDNYDIQINDKHHNVYFTNPEYTKIGVQAKYVVDGVENVSGVAYYGSTGISEANVEEELEAEEYTDLLGNRVTSPTAGLYIKTMIYSDGSRKSVKTFVK